MNVEHLNRLLSGAEQWNKYREKHPNFSPDLIGADLQNTCLTHANLRVSALKDADLRGANLSFANLDWANIQGADLRNANLHRTSLAGNDLSNCTITNIDISKSSKQQLVDLVALNPTVWNRLRRMSPSFRPDLSGTDFTAANLDGIDFSYADLRMCDFRNTHLNSLLWGANLAGADLTNANLSSAQLANFKGVAADFTDAILRGVQFTPMDDDVYLGATFLDLGCSYGLNTATFDSPSFLVSYLEKAFEYIHNPPYRTKTKFSEFLHVATSRIRDLRRLSTMLSPSVELIEVVRLATDELIRYLATHPQELHRIRPRQFEELIGEVLASYGWEITLTPATRDGGYDLIGVTKDASGLKTSWIIECKKYSPTRKVGVDIVRNIYGIHTDLRIANVLLATTSFFSSNALEFKASRYDLEFRDYEGVLEWLNHYRPHPNGTMYINDHHLVIPGDEDRTNILDST